MMNSVSHYSRPELLQLQVNLDAMAVMNSANLLVAIEQYPHLNSLTEPATQNK
jgi:hypothetical protein